MISIGIPFYNSEATLASAIRSVFAQTNESWELLLVDDGSTDQSLSIARSVRDPRVRVFSDKSRYGLPARLNQIAQLAAGTYVARMDADDLMHPFRLERQLNFLKANSHVDLVSCLAFVIDNRNCPWGRMEPASVTISPQQMLLRPNILHPSVLGKTEWFRRHQYDPSYVRCEDRELWCRTSICSTIYRMPELLMFYRQPLNVDVETYLIGTANLLRVLRNYGRPMVGLSRCAGVAASLCSHALSSCFASKVGLGKVLARRKYLSLSSNEYDEAAAVIRHILSTPVNDLDGPRRECAVELSKACPLSLA